MYTYEYPRPALTVDCAIFGWNASTKTLHVLMIERAKPPYEGKWAFPGGFVDPGETTDTAAARELQEETLLSNVYMEQFYTFSDPDRDPRGRVVSVAYIALVNMQALSPEAADDARSVEWFPIQELPELAFDHAMIFAKAYDHLKFSVRLEPKIIFQSLSEEFTIDDLAEIYKAILYQDINIESLKSQMLDSLIISPIENSNKLYSYTRREFEKGDFFLRI